MKTPLLTHTCQPEDRIARFSDDGAQYLLFAADCFEADDCWAAVVREMRRRQKKAPGTGFRRSVATGGEVVIETRPSKIAAAKSLPHSPQTTPVEQNQSCSESRNMDPR